MAYNLVKVRYNKTDANGKTKKVTNQYLVDCVSKSEGETRITKELSSFYHDFQIKSIADAKISEIFFNDVADKFYLVNVAFITYDDKTGAEKQTITQILVQANCFIDALERFNESMKGTLADFEIKSLSETKIMDVLPIKLG